MRSLPSLSAVTRTDQADATRTICVFCIRSRADGYQREHSSERHFHIVHEIGEILIVALQRIRVRYDIFPSKSRTLEDLVRNEKPERRRLATEALMWLFRCVPSPHYMNLTES